MYKCRPICFCRKNPHFLFYLSFSLFSSRINNDDIADTKLRPAKVAGGFEDFFLKFLGPLAIVEENSQVYGVQLNSEPTKPVKINIDVKKPRPDTPAAISLSKSQLTFDSSNWDIVQAVEINVLKDDVDSILDGEDFFLIHSTETEDQVYAKKAMNMTIVVRVEDDDDAGIIFDNDDILEVKEG